MSSPRPLGDRLAAIWPNASLRAYLAAVMLLAIAPIAAIMSLQIYTEVRSEQAQLEEDLTRSAAAFSGAVQDQLLSAFDGLAVLAQSELFQQGRVAALGRLLQGRPRRDWDSVFLLDRDGTLVLDTAAPHVPDAGDALRELQRRVVRQSRPAVTGVAGIRRSGGRFIAVAVPVVQNGAVRYVLGARMDEAVWQRLSSGASKPAGANAALFDAQDRLIGYSMAVVAPAGTALPRDAAASMRGRPWGVHRSSDVDGRVVYAAWQAVPVAGWHVRVALPAAPIDAAHRKAIVAALSTSGGSLLLGLLLAALVARRVARPLRQLATQGPAGLPGPVPVREVALLRDALLRSRLEDTAAHGALRESQRLTELAQEAGHVGFFHYRFGADRLTWTPGQCRLFGIDALPCGTLRDWLDRIAAADRDRVEREFWTACALRRERETLEYCVARPDGKARWLSSRVMLQFDGEGRAAQLIGVSVDMTDRMEAERERAQLTERALVARSEAEAASRAKDEFLTLLSHELRNPLGAISAAVDVLEAAEPGSANAAEARAIIARQTGNLAHMMNDLLDVGRVMAGTIALARQPVNLAAVVRAVDERLARTGAAKEHPLRLDLRDAWVDGDPVRIEQVVTNLLTHAIRDTPAGRPIHVHVDLHQGCALLQVQDSGKGIPPALLSLVCDRFVQGERPLDRGAGGLGIGWTLVRRLVELHGGTVAVTSSDEGSLFTVRLPLAAPPEPTNPDTPPPSRRRQVLVVEGNGDVLAGLRCKLELDGHSVSTATDGIEGLNRLLQLKPEVSIIDIGLPRLTGFELARHARAAGYAGRLIALSGYGAARDAQEALVAGFDACLVKPVDRDQLRASLSAD